MEEQLLYAKWKNENIEERRAWGLRQLTEHELRETFEEVTSKGWYPKTQAADQKKNVSH